MLRNTRSRIAAKTLSVVKWDRYHAERAANDHHCPHHQKTGSSKVVSIAPLLCQPTTGGAA